MADNTIQMPGTTKTPTTQENLDTLKRDFDIILEYLSYKARMKRQYFIELKKAGFSNSEALIICCKDTN